MKSAHKVFKLHHQKHTGKILHHRHTSYHVLFLLMLLPILMFALVGHLVGASDYVLTATVPAPLPGGASSIDSPANGQTVYVADINVTGDCPIISPAIIVAIYDGPSLLGSQTCTVSGTFVVPVSLTLGTHSLVATNVSITNQYGASSAPPVIVTRALPPVTPSPTPSPSPSPTPSPTPSPGKPHVTPSPSPNPTPSPAPIPTPPVETLVISSNQPVIIFGPGNDAIWRGSFGGGILPYTLTIDWGDKSVDTYTVADHTEHSYTHHYAKAGSYTVKVVITDGRGNTASHSTVAASPAHKPVPTPIGSTTEPANWWDWNMSLERFPLLQLYVIVLILLLILWYIEHGRHKLRKILIAKQPRRTGRA